MRPSKGVCREKNWQAVVAFDLIPSRERTRMKRAQRHTLFSLFPVLQAAKGANLNSPQANKKKHRTIVILIAAFLLCAGLLPLIGLARNTSLGSGGEGSLEKTWGRIGVRDGRFRKPRAMAIDDRDQVYIVDKTARIQVFDREGNFLRQWQTPEYSNGKPTGLSFNREGLLMVADTHYFRVLFYRPDGTLVKERTLGGEFGHQPGMFGLVTDVVEDSQGNLYVSEYGEFDRIQKFDSDGNFLMQWGGHGSEPGQFLRPQNLAVDENDHIWVVDACNDRVQVFDATGEEARLIRIWGERGKESGQLRYPYDLVLDGEGHIYICEFGNHRVQKLTLEGESLGSWGTQGRGAGQLFNPWAIVRDSNERIHVLDTYNHRLHRIRF